MADSQKMGSRVASDGMRIDDHANWTGKAAKGSVFAPNAKMKSIEEEEGAGSVMRYEDTEERIASAQKEGVRQIKNRPLKPGYRN